MVPAPASSNDQPVSRAEVPLRSEISVFKNRKLRNFLCGLDKLVSNLLCEKLADPRQHVDAITFRKNVVSGVLVLDEVEIDA